jgi:hypothetical protein
MIEVIVPIKNICFPSTIMLNDEALNWLEAEVGKGAPHPSKGNPTTWTYLRVQDGQAYFIFGDKQKAMQFKLVWG